MPRKNPPTGTDADLNLGTLLPLFTDEDKAREFVEAKRWADGRKCPHCGCGETYALTPKAESKSPVRKGVYKCKECRKQFTVRVGSVFEDSKLPIRVWLKAIHLMCEVKNGISSHELARRLGITQKSAWFVEHRIREAIKVGPSAGIVECLEGPWKWMKLLLAPVSRDTKAPEKTQRISRPRCWCLSNAAANLLRFRSIHLRSKTSKDQCGRLSTSPRAS